MSSLGNFLFGSYATGFVFMLFFIEDIDGSTYERNMSHRIFAGLFWPLAAISFFFIRLRLFIVGK
jgi:hypothetical protein